jgi:hypothetical protein
MSVCRHWLVKRNVAGDPFYSAADPDPAEWPYLLLMPDDESPSRYSLAAAFYGKTDVDVNRAAIRAYRIADCINALEGLDAAGLEQVLCGAKRVVEFVDTDMLPRREAREIHKLASALEALEL